jgi:hypothetical protein
MSRRFNLGTMSGVFPGTRTQIFQRIRLRRLHGEPQGSIWAQLLWYEEPAACVLSIQIADGQWATTPLLHLSAPFDKLNQRLQAALREAGWQLETCGSCRFWQPVTTTTADGLPGGRCRWQPTAFAETAMPPILAVQSTLALSCPHWQTPDQADAPHGEATPVSAVQPMRKIAEITESKLPLAARLQRKLSRWLRPRSRRSGWEEKLVERSGVGAGTESCFACQGRIANLGALAVETPEGDTQTFSVWRCRHCSTTYLNDWIDRWVRLENLETEETYYRLAPAEALALLDIIYNITGGEHPGRRRERRNERSQLIRFIAGRNPLSHQVRQGR